MNLLAAVNITNVSTKKEKAGDKPGPMRTTLSISNTVSVDAVSGLFGTDAAFGTFKETNWLENGEFANSDIRQFPLEGEITGAEVVLNSFSGTEQKFQGGVLKDIALLLGPNHTVTVDAKLQLPNVTPEQVGLLHSWEGYEVNARVSPAQGELDLAAGAKGEKKGKGKKSGDQQPLH